MVMTEEGVVSLRLCHETSTVFTTFISGEVRFQAIIFDSKKKGKPFSFMLGAGEAIGNREMGGI